MNYKTNPILVGAAADTYGTVHGADTVHRAGAHTVHAHCDQYNANKANNTNGGLKWIEKGSGYYSECNKRLKG